MPETTTPALDETDRHGIQRQEAKQAIDRDGHADRSSVTDATLCSSCAYGFGAA
jgi:hypothetical protein